MTLKRIFVFIFFAGLVIGISGCVSPPVEKNADIKDLDKKITEEFDAHIKEKNFYAAGNSFIEFSACCGGKKKEEMIQDLKGLLRTTIDEKRESNDKLGVITAIFSFINLIQGTSPEYQVNEYKEELNKNLHDFITTELEGKGDLEKASWILYLSNFFIEDPFPYKLLTEIFIGRNNPILASKYAASFSETVRKNDLSGDRSGRSGADDTPILVRLLTNQFQFV